MLILSSPRAASFSSRLTPTANDSSTASRSCCSTTPPSITSTPRSSTSCSIISRCSSSRRTAITSRHSTTECVSRASNLRPLPLLCVHFPSRRDVHRALSSLLVSPRRLSVGSRSFCSALSMPLRTASSQSASASMPLSWRCSQRRPATASTTATTTTECFSTFIYAHALRQCAQSIVRQSLICGVGVHIMSRVGSDVCL